MNRWMLVVAVSLGSLNTATASLSRKDQPNLRKSLPTKSLDSLNLTPNPDDYRVTANTEVLLDGKPCRYEEVPNGVTIILMEIVSNENKEILKLHFKTTPRPPVPMTAERP
jgi:hypothetical protein